MYKSIEIALEEVGYLEKKSNDQLDEKRANAGDKNFTKYARDLDALGNFYNGKKQGYPWCDVFVDWCFVKAYGPELARQAIYQPLKSLGAGVLYSAEYYKSAGQYFNTPKVGDQIFFGKDGKYTHTGLVYQVGETYVDTIEGNTSGASRLIPNGGGVCKKTYKIGSSEIFGYGRPNYNIAEGKFDMIIERIQKGSKGTLVKTAQAILIKKYGISCGIYGADGSFGNATEKAVKKFQTAHGMDPNGVVEEKTWEALLF